MLIELIRGNMSILGFVFILISLVIGLVVHEFSHGYAAYLLGDDTAKSEGRLSLNPLKHIDPVGFFAIMLVGFGWAKPVMMNPYKFKHLRDGIALTALAGPLSNFILAIIGALLLNINAPMVVVAFLQSFVTMNIILATFNILPIPPLDGFKVFGRILPDNIFYKVENFANRYGMYILLILLVTRIIYSIWYPIYGLSMSFMNFLSTLF